MKSLPEVPNIGKNFQKNSIGIKNEQELKQLGSKNAIIKMATIKNSGAV